ncbi:MAG: hypothetical protein ACI376_05310 [Candidatus Bruticola sp.]
MMLGNCLQYYKDFGVRRTNLRGQQAVENDIGLVLMTMNLTKLGKMMTHLRAKFLKNGKNRTTIFEKGKNYGSVFYIKD